MSRDKIVVFTGAGISAESGISTFRDSNGLWENHRIEDVASPEGWARNPHLVLDFYNQRRKNMLAASPNAAHQALVALEEKYEVIIVTQNVDNLHERAGSSHVLHVHGELCKARSTLNPALVYTLDGPDINWGDRCELGSQLRPHIVWFGEQVDHLEEAAHHFSTAEKILTVGTSLAVYPVAGLLDLASADSERILVGPDPVSVPWGWQVKQGTATQYVPQIVAGWLADH